MTYWRNNSESNRNSGESNRRWRLLNRPALFLRGLMTCMSVCWADRLSPAECRLYTETGGGGYGEALSDWHCIACCCADAAAAGWPTSWNDGQITAALWQCHYSWCLTARFTGSLCQSGDLATRKDWCCELSHMASYRGKLTQGKICPPCGEGKRRG